VVVGALAATTVWTARAAEYADHYQRYQEAIEAKDLESAVVHARRAYLAAVRERGPADEYTGVLAYNLGVVNLELGRYRDATVAFEKALPVYEAVHGADSERIVLPLTKLAAAHQALEEWDAAERSYVRATRIIEKTRGDDDPALAGLFGQLALVADGLGEPKRMRAYGLRALAVAHRGEADPISVANLHLSVARAEMLIGDVRQAKRHTDVAVELYEKNSPPRDPQLIKVYGFAADIYEHYGKDYTARKYRRKVEEAGGAAD